MKRFFCLWVLSTVALFAQGSGDVVERAAVVPLELVSSKVVPGNNFRMTVTVVVKAAAGAAVTEVDGVCLATVNGARQEYPAYVQKDGAGWRLDFSVPRNSEYYIEAFALSAPSEAEVARAKKAKTKPKKTRSEKLLVEVKA